jgi:hypothetical protein
MFGSDTAASTGSNTKIAYRVPDAAAQIGVSEREMWRLVKSREIPSVKYGPHRTSPRVVTHQALVAWVTKKAGEQAVQVPVAA